MRDKALVFVRQAKNHRKASLSTQKVKVLGYAQTFPYVAVKEWGWELARRVLLLPCASYKQDLARTGSGLCKHESCSQNLSQVCVRSALFYGSCIFECLGALRQYHKMYRPLRVFQAFRGTLASVWGLEADYRSGICPCWRRPTGSPPRPPTLPKSSRPFGWAGIETSGGSPSHWAEQRKSKQVRCSRVLESQLVCAIPFAAPWLVFYSRAVSHLTLLGRRCGFCSQVFIERIESQLTLLRQVLPELMGFGNCWFGSLKVPQTPFGKRLS